MPHFVNPEITRIERLTDTRIYVWDIKENIQELLAMLPVSSDYRREMEERFCSEKRCREWLAVRVLLHRVAGMVSPICYRQSGCPYLLDSELNVSISHTSHFATLVLSGNSVGADIEQFGGKALRLVDKFLKAEEQRLFAQTALSPENASVLSWSAKEAVFKVAGNTSLSLLENLTILEINESAELMTIHIEQFYGEQLGRGYAVHYAFLDDFVFTIANPLV